jgi:transcriptional regulatory protein LEU3
MSCSRCEARHQHPLDHVWACCYSRADWSSSYSTTYHPFLPILDVKRTPHEYYQISELLFWSIMSVSSRRLASQPMLLQKLARSVTDLFWKTIRTVPYSLTTVQSLALLCTWPFPISNSTADLTPMLIGCMLQAGTQIGLHCAMDAQDFARVPTRLDAFEHAEWVRSWKACKIVAQRLVCCIRSSSQHHEN